MGRAPKIIRTSDVMGAVKRAAEDAEDRADWRSSGSLKKSRVAMTTELVQYPSVESNSACAKKVLVQPEACTYGDFQPDFDSPGDVKLMPSPCQQCDSPNVTQRCLTCPTYNVVLANYNDGHGSWVSE